VIAALNAFDADMRAKGVKVFLSYPAVPHEYLARNERAVRRIRERLETELTLPVLGTPEDSAFAITDFFDTQYHMTGDAPVRRTAQVAELLKRRLDVPPPPTGPAAESIKR
jgi:hypothetical protein